MTLTWTGSVISVRVFWNGKVQLKVKHCSEGQADLMGIISSLTDLIEGSVVEGSTHGCLAKEKKSPGEHRSPLSNRFLSFHIYHIKQRGWRPTAISPPIYPALICGGQSNLMLVNQGYRWSLLGLGVSEPKSIAPVRAAGGSSESDVEGRLQGLSNGRRVHACAIWGWITPLLTAHYTQAPAPFIDGGMLLWHCSIPCSSCNVWCTVMNRWQWNAIWG